MKKPVSITLSVLLILSLFASIITSTAFWRMNRSPRSRNSQQDCKDKEIPA